MNLKNVIGLVFVVFLIAPFTVEGKDCQYWKAVAGVKETLLPDGFVDEADPKIVLEGIECLLALEGDKTRGAFGGAAHNQVSEMLPMTTVEVCALYYVSKIFYQKYDHSNGVVLVDKKNRWNNKTSVAQAFKSYRKWFATVRKLGLAEARQQRLDPLNGSGVSWY